MDFYWVMISSRRSNWSSSRFWQQVRNRFSCDFIIFEAICVVLRQRHETKTKYILVFRYALCLRVGWNKTKYRSRRTWFCQILVLFFPSNLLLLVVDFLYTTTISWEWWRRSFRWVSDMQVLGTKESVIILLSRFLSIFLLLTSALETSSWLVKGSPNKIYLKNTNILKTVPRRNCNQEEKRRS